MAQRYTKHLFRDESGSIMMVAVFGLFLLMAILALSIDHGRNYLHQSDMEAKLTALTKVAGNEYTYWQIRKEVNTAAANAGLPGVTDPVDCKVYILCYVSHPQSGYPADGDYPLGTLRYFVEQQVNAQLGNQYPCTGNPACVTVDAPVIKFNNSATTPANYLLFNAHRAQEKDFASTVAATGDQQTTDHNTPARQVNVQSGVLINTIDNRSIASQMVFSLDKDSANQLSGGQDFVNQVFTLLQTATSTQASIDNAFRVGMTIGNVPVRGPTSTGNSGSGAVVANGLDGDPSGLGVTGGSGGLYDNKPNFDGTDLGTVRIARHSRVYTYQANFIASDAVRCANPVWVYRTVASKTTCNVTKKTSNIPGDPACPDVNPPLMPTSFTGYPANSFPAAPPLNPANLPCTGCGAVQNWVNGFNP